MKSISICLLFVLILSMSALGSVRILKLEKEINSPDDFTDLATVNSGPYSRIRISIRKLSPDPETAKGFGMSYFDFDTRLKALDDADDVWFRTVSGHGSFDEVIEVPPPVLRVSIKSKSRGKYRIVVWGSI